MSFLIRTFYPELVLVATVGKRFASLFGEGGCGINYPGVALELDFD